MIFKVKAQSLNRENFTGGDNATITNGGAVFTFSFSNENIAKIIFNCPYSTDNSVDLHNTQNITNNPVTSPAAVSSTLYQDSYGNNYQQMEVDNPGDMVTMTLGFSGTTSVNIPATFNPTDIYPLQNIPSSVSSYVNATDNIQSTDSHIKSIAQSLVTANTPLYKVVEALAEYVFENIDYNATVNQDAISVLTNKLGSCAGYTNLMVALLRSIGIPARYVAGIHMSTNGPHAVYEVYFPSLGQWIEGDAQGSVFFCNSNFFILGHYGDMDQKQSLYNSTIWLQAGLTAEDAPTIDVVENVGANFTHTPNINPVGSLIPLTCNRTNCNATLMSISDGGGPIVGTGDAVTIQNPPSCTPVPPGTSLINNTTIMSPCTNANASFFAGFSSGGGLSGDQPTFPSDFKWSLNLYYSGGSYTYSSGTTSGNLLYPYPCNSNPNNSYYPNGTLWQPTLGTVPNYAWTYDYAGNIMGEVDVTVDISDGTTTSTSAIIGVSPNMVIRNVTYSSNITVNGCGAEMDLINVTVNNNASVIFNTNGTGIIINEPFQATKGSALKINK